MPEPTPTPTPTPAAAPAIQTDGRVTQAWLQDLLAEMLGKALAEERAANIAKGTAIMQRRGSAAFAPPSAYDDDDAVTSRGKHDDRGLTFAGVVRALRVAVKSGSGDKLAFAREWAGKNMAYNPAVAQALDSTTLTDGGALVPAAVIREIVEFLRPASVFRSLGPNFDRFDAGGKYEIARITSGFTASRRGENRAIPLTSPTTGSLTASPHDCTGLYIQSSQWMRRATPDSDRILRDDLARCITQRQDYDYIRGDGSANSVKGIKNLMLAANSTGATSSPTLAQTFTDLGTLWLAIREADFGNPRLGWLWAPRTTVYLWTLLDGQGNPVFRAEMLTGNVWGAPYRDTTQIPKNLGGGGDESEIYLANFAGLTVIDGETIRVDMSSDASIVDGATTHNLFQDDQVAVRMIAEDDLIDRYAGKSAAMLTAVDWTP